MKVAQIVSTFPPYRGGIGNSAYHISDILSDLGHEVTIFTPNYNLTEDNIEPLGQASKFTVRRLKPLIKIGNAALIPQLFFVLKGFDIIHLHYPFYGSLKAILLKKLFSGNKIKLILHYHMDTRAAGLKGFIFYLYKISFLPLLARSAEIITCASLDYIKHSDLRKYYLKKPNKFKQISYGVDLDQFVIYRDNLNKERDHDVILFVGGLDRAHYFKGLENLIKAMAEIKKIKKFSSIVLNIVGRGDLSAYYKKSVNDYGLEKEVIFHENVDNNELVNFYNYCDCLVLPSINQGESFGLVLLEAMACAKPVITSNLPGVRSVFKNGVQGLLVKPNNVEDLAEKIKFILNNKKTAETMGRAGRILVEKKYTWEKVGRKLDSLYNYVKYCPSYSNFR